MKFKMIYPLLLFSSIIYPLGRFLEYFVLPYFIAESESLIANNQQLSFGIQNIIYLLGYTPICLFNIFLIKELNGKKNKLLVILIYLLTLSILSRILIWPFEGSQTYASWVNFVRLILFLAVYVKLLLFFFFQKN